MDLVLNKRRGFVRLALEAGADLVPVLAFGENDQFRRMEVGALDTLQRTFKRVRAVGRPAGRQARGAGKAGGAAWAGCRARGAALRAGTWVLPRPDGSAAAPPCPALPALLHRSPALRCRCRTR